MDKIIYEPIDLYKIFKLNRSGDYEIAAIESNLIMQKYILLKEIPIEKQTIYFDFEELLKDYERELTIEVIKFILDFFENKKH